MYIIRKEFNGRSSYSTSCNNKKKELKYYMSVEFYNCGEPKTENIKVLDFFMSCYESKDGIKPKMIITSYDEITIEGNPMWCGKPINCDNHYQDVKTEKPNNVEETDMFTEFGKEHEDDLELELPF